MAKIDSVYDLSDKALVEIKSWLEPWFLTRDRGGAIDSGIEWEDVGIVCGAISVGDVGIAWEDVGVTC